MRFNFDTKQSIGGFLSALNFLTVLRIGKNAGFDPVRMIPMFPMTGLLIGVLLLCFDSAASLLWDQTAVALLDVLFLAAVTGALHIDGLGDTADGLFSHRPIEKILVIMKDSRIGIMGLMAVFFGMTVKWMGISGIGDHRWLYLILIPAYARGAMIFGIRFLPYGRPGGGTGTAFFDTPLDHRAFAWMLIPVGLSLFLGSAAIWLNLAFAALAGGLLAYYHKRMGFITGDMLGALCEITETMLFFIVSAGGGA